MFLSILRTSARRWTALAVAALLVTAVALGWWLQSAPTPSSRAEPLACALPTPTASTPYPGMVWVPGGALVQGDTVYREEQPLRAVQVAGFWMDRTEVTNAQFAAFVQATGYVTTAERPVDRQQHPNLPPELQKPGAVVFTMPTDRQGGGDITQWWRYLPGASWRHPGGPGTDIVGREAFPVVAVTWADAQAYAQWRGHSLPTEEQWEWAAREARTDSPRVRTQPEDANTWQGLFPVVNSGDDGFLGVAPVGCYKANALGLLDMIGNVWELTASAYTSDLSGPPDAPAVQRDGNGNGNTNGKQRVIKGGSFLCAPSYCMRYRAGARQPQDDDLAASHLGFRTIRTAPGP